MEVEMKTLRLLRNIAALFILVAALLAPRPAAGDTFCISKPGYGGCFADKNGNCTDVKCTPGSYCNNLGCGQLRIKGF